MLRGNGGEVDRDGGEEGMTDRNRRRGKIGQEALYEKKINKNRMIK